MASAHSTHMHALWVNFFKKSSKNGKWWIFNTENNISFVHNTFIHSHHQAETSKNTETHHDIIYKYIMCGSILPFIFLRIVHS